MKFNKSFSLNKKKSDQVVKKHSHTRLMWRQKKSDQVVIHTHSHDSYG